MDGFFIYNRTFASITATLQRKHIIRWINGLWWQIICNGQHSSATAPWQMWQMDFNAFATRTCWFSNVWTSVADVYVILYDNSLSCHPEELCDEGSRVHPLYYSLLYVHEILRFALDDKTKTPYLHTNMQARQGRFINAPRRIHEFVKEFSRKHLGLFQKVLHLFKKLRQVFKELFLQNKDIRSIIIHQYWLS